MQPDWLQSVPRAVACFVSVIGKGAKDPAGWRAGVYYRHIKLDQPYLLHLAPAKKHTILYIVAVYLPSGRTLQVRNIIGSR